jgi:hypothetical protein
VGDVHATAGQLVAQRPFIEAADTATQASVADQRQRDTGSACLQLAIDEVQPVDEAVRTDGIVTLPQAATAETAQVLTYTRGG